MTSIAPGTFIWLGILAGLIGTAGMTIVLNSVTKSGVANADMVRAVGSLFTKKLENSSRVGLMVHFSSGIVFAFLYLWAMLAFNVNGFLNLTGSGALIGFIHGAVVGFLLVAAVAENHPVKEFQKAGFSVAVAHWGAHIIYGLLVGAVIGIVGF